MRPMHEAPRDGTRILIKRKVFHYVSAPEQPISGYSHVGDRWEECWWDTRDRGAGPRWQPWSGNTHTFSTDSFKDADAHGWVPTDWLEVEYNVVLATIARSLGAFGNAAQGHCIAQQIDYNQMHAVIAISEGLLAIADDLTRGP